MTLRFTATLALAACLTACQSTSTSSAETAATTPAPAPASDEGPYAYIEKVHDGRLYVLGSAASAEAFEASGHMPYTLTLIGAGPQGRTVVIEIDKEDPALQEWLKAQVNARYYYFEELHDGRIYVLGQPATHAAFRQTHHMPYTLTLIGAGPDGETVVIEIDKDDAALQERLKAEFQRRHG